MALEFQVPQFIEVEDKIFGPFTLKQFLYLAGGASVVFVLYALFGLMIAIIVGLPVGGFAAALAFYKINEQPFIKYVESGLKFSTGNKIYVWHQPAPEKKAAEVKKEPEAQKIITPEITRDKLKELAWSLDIKEKIK